MRSDTPSRKIGLLLELALPASLPLPCGHVGTNVPPLPVRPRVLLLSGDRAVENPRSANAWRGKPGSEASRREELSARASSTGTAKKPAAGPGMSVPDRSGRWGPGTGPGGPRWKAWSFSEEGFLRANGAVLDALEWGTGLVLIDEIGPVEWELGAGSNPP
jgi:hypothetical protein